MHCQDKRTINKGYIKFVKRRGIRLFFTEMVGLVKSARVLERNRKRIKVKVFVAILYFTF